ncbi:flagellar hook-length control protein FliK [Roseibium sp.]|uniref:flagellar hook-length control protein FliK n=1 Tax=Roseibium sp. TaxID=1936156 RepID=UPI003A972CC4
MNAGGGLATSGGSAVSGAFQAALGVVTAADASAPVAVNQGGAPAPDLSAGQGGKGSGSDAQPVVPGDLAAGSAGSSVELEGVEGSGVPGLDDAEAALQGDAAAQEAAAMIAGVVAVSITPPVASAQSSALLGASAGSVDGSDVPAFSPEQGEAGDVPPSGLGRAAGAPVPGAGLEAAGLSTGAAGGQDEVPAAGSVSVQVAASGSGAPVNGASIGLDSAELKSSATEAASGSSPKAAPAAEVTSAGAVSGVGALSTASVTDPAGGERRWRAGLPVEARAGSAQAGVGRASGELLGAEPVVGDAQAGGAVSAVASASLTVAPAASPIASEDAPVPVKGQTPELPLPLVSAVDGSAVSAAGANEAGAAAVGQLAGNGADAQVRAAAATAVLQGTGDNHTTEVAVSRPAGATATLSDLADAADAAGLEKIVMHRDSASAAINQSINQQSAVLTVTDQPQAAAQVAVAGAGQGKTLQSQTGTTTSDQATSPASVVGQADEGDVSSDDGVVLRRTTEGLIPVTPLIEDNRPGATAGIAGGAVNSGSAAGTQTTGLGAGAEALTGGGAPASAETSGAAGVAGAAAAVGAAKADTDDSDGELPFSLSAQPVTSGEALASGKTVNLPSPSQAHSGQVATQVATAMARNLSNGSTSFQMRFDPPELGRVDVHLKVASDGSVQAHLVVDRPETLDMFLRDQRGLERAFQEAGLKADMDNLQFSLQDQGGQGFAEGRNEDEGQFGGGWSGGSGDESSEIDSSAEMAARYSGAASSGLDIRI